MPIKIYKEKMEYLNKALAELPQKSDPKDYRSTPNVTITWVENCSGKTKIRDQELISDENAHSTGFGKGVSPGRTFLAGFGFSHFTLGAGSRRARSGNRLSGRAGAGLV
jgi:hypothetical protein